MSKRVTCILPDELHKVLKVHAAETDRTLIALIEEAVHEYVVRLGSHTHEVDLP